MSLLPAEIRDTAEEIRAAADEGALASRALMGRGDVSPELALLLTELRGFFVCMRAEAHRLQGLIGAAVMTSQVETQETLPPGRMALPGELPLLVDVPPRAVMGHPPRHAPALPGKDLAAGERPD